MSASEFLEGRKLAPASLGDVLVLGLGKSGRAAADYLLAQLGARVNTLCIAAGTDNEANRQQGATYADRGVRVLYGEQVGEGRYDLCVASPGISQFSGFYRAAQAVSDEVISEVELAWRESAADSRWLAITGTNGKTTTTALAAHLLAACDWRAAAVGNIGDTCIDAVASGEVDMYVAEVSSYQLASTNHFAPDAAILLNITPDHLKWHQGMDNYIEAKARVYANMAESHGVVVMDATNDIVRAKVRELKAIPEDERGFQYVAMGTREGLAHDMHEACGARNSAFLDDGWLCVRFNDTVMRLVASESLQIPGEHNASNALAAAAAALALGASQDAVAQALCSFAPLEHRIEPCGIVAGVACYNDSKATNVDATLKALAAFGQRRPIVLLGGDDKGTDLEPLVQQAQRHCKAAVCYGDGGPRFLKAFEGSSLPTYEAAHMADALDVAFGLAQEGDIILLSPACASFDEFTSFEHRGRVFKDLVAARARQVGA